VWGRYHITRVRQTSCREARRSCLVDDDGDGLRCGDVPHTMRQVYYTTCCAYTVTLYTYSVRHVSVSIS
jgi:hypothetical protein